MKSVCGSRIRPLVESRDLGNLDAVETACARNAIGWAMDLFGGFGHDLATWTTHEMAPRQEVSSCTDSLLLGCSHLAGSTGLQVESAEDVLIWLPRIA